MKTHPDIWIVLKVVDYIRDDIPIYAPQLYFFTEEQALDFIAKKDEEDDDRGYIFDRLQFGGE